MDHLIRWTGVLGSECFTPRWNRITLISDHNHRNFISESCCAYTLQVDFKQKFLSKFSIVKVTLLLFNIELLHKLELCRLISSLEILLASANSQPWSWHGWRGIDRIIKTVSRVRMHCQVNCFEGRRFGDLRFFLWKLFESPNSSTAARVRVE